VSLDALKLAVYRRLPRPLQRWAVRHATPNFTVGAVALLTMTGEELLLVRTSYRKGWLPPGGLLERGETPMAGAARELVEELGLHVALEEPHRVELDPDRLAVTFLGVGTLPEGTRPVSHSPELIAAEWFPLTALPPLSPDFHEGITQPDLQAIRHAAAGRSPEGGVSSASDLEHPRPPTR
jgi:ADP-ribose pyrophosphatase YjhB (NUDIX family)